MEYLLGMHAMAAAAVKQRDFAPKRTSVINIPVVSDDEMAIMVHVPFMAWGMIDDGLMEE